jgi:Pyridoxamine 5'-phosphate oxidase
VTVPWDDDVDAIIAGDAAVGFASVTPARGVVIVPMAPLGIRDRDAGTVTVTSSLGLPKKFERLRENPSVALAYHAREHGDSASPLYVLVQGTAEVQQRPNRAWLESITPQWEHFLGPRHGGPVGRLMDVYYWERLAITVQVRRVVVYDGTSARPRILGDDLPAEIPEAQRPPKHGTRPRVDTAKLAAQVNRLPHTLLGWVGTDGLPMVARVRAHGTSERGLSLASSDGPLPPGGRRAGLTAHAFQRHMVGQEQRVHTGWLDVDGTEASYAPHTRAGYALPRSQALMTLGSIVGTRAGYRKARQLGLTT